MSEPTPESDRITNRNYSLMRRHIEAVQASACVATLREGRPVSGSEILRRILDLHFGEQGAAK